MKTGMFLLSVGLLLSTLWGRADETVTVTATSTDISENLDLKTVATLFGQAKDLEQFEQMLNNPDSAFSNLDLNGDGQVDYLRVIETADNTRHLVVIQAVLAKDVYQDVASIYVEKDPETQSVTVQVIGDEYIYGTNYIIEPVYVYRPYIYDWFWGPDWVCWYSPYYWDYWPGWWHPYYCVAPYIYWDHCYWHHHWHPICSYRTGHHPHDHFRPMYEHVSRSDYAARHPERSFATRNAGRNISNARSFDIERRAATRTAMSQGASTRSAVAGTSTRSAASSAAASRSFGSSNIRTSSATATRSTSASTRSTTTAASRSNSSTSVTTRTASTPSRTAATATSRTAGSTTSRSSVAAPTRSSSSISATRTASTTTNRSSYQSSSSRSSRSTSATPTRSYNSSSSRSYNSSSAGSYSSPSRSSGSTMRSSTSGGSMRSSGGSYSGGSRSSGGGSSSRSTRR